MNYILHTKTFVRYIEVKIDDPLRIRLVDRYDPTRVIDIHKDTFQELVLKGVYMRVFNKDALIA